MDTIDTFLDAMFAPYPATERLLEAKAELRTMMEDAYNDALASGRTHNEAVGAVITDFGNLEELAPVLGITTDLKDGHHPGAAVPAGGGEAGTNTGTGTGGGNEAGTGGGTRADHTAPGSATPAGARAEGSPRPGHGTYPSPRYPAVTLPEAQRLADARRDTAGLLGWGVMLLVLAPALPGVLTALTGPAATAQGLAPSVGLSLLLVMVAAGVSLLILRSRAFADIRHLTSGHFTADPVVTAWAARLRADHEQTRTRRLIMAVCLWILAGVPAVIMSALSAAPGPEGRGPWAGGPDISALGGPATLLLVAVGLRLFLPANWAASTEKTLRAPWSAASDDADSDPLIGLVASVYWPACVVVFLLWGFLWDGWDRSWIIWPVAGILFGAFAAARSTWTSHQRRQDPRLLG